MKIRVILALFIAGGFAPQAGAQPGTSVGGRVLPAWQVELAGVLGESDYRVTVESSAMNRVTLLLEPLAAQAKPLEVAFVVRLRTNAPAFRVFAEAGEGPVQLKLSAPSADGSGTLLIANAMDEFRGETTVVLNGRERLLAAGGRISAGGSFRSRENALLLPLSLRGLGEDRSKPIRLSLRIGE